ncbi:hypothetical protein PoB_000608400 [Plakobranchus ocellatus]|uniref:Uncharacterized protein n=1 Tax=Plakobranchus ocellatus TaxID=259542 RepID=A0AAV3YBC5_9GAST|nr:hypothetical protein PoB_000608400 [Plakobranchus ocellatus]
MKSCQYTNFCILPNNVLCTGEYNERLVSIEIRHLLLSQKRLWHRNATKIAHYFTSSYVGILITPEVVPFPSHCLMFLFGGVGGTVACESALRSAGTLLSRVRAPPSAPRPVGGPKSLKSPCCGLAI